MRARLLGVLLAASIAPLAGCRSGDPPGPGQAPSAEPREVHDPHGPPSQHEVPTTAGRIAVDNLNAQIASLEGLIARNARDLASRQNLCALLGTRAKYLGRIADAERAAALAEELVRDAPKQSASYVARASARASMHHFADALADLAEAEKLGARTNALLADRASILEGQGDLDGALALRRKAREIHADVTTLGTEAALIGQLGRTEEASALFRRAALEYRGVSPFPIAWVLQQEGLLWERAGDTARARAFFAAALDRLPAYAHAASHLAAIDPPDRAAALLAPLLDGSRGVASDDPEIELVLASRLRAAGDAAGADARVAHVRARYAELMERHPEAFAEHAAGFWLDEGKDPAKALALAKIDLTVRRTEKAYRLAILAALAAGARGEACALGKDAVKIPHASEMLQGIAKDACAKGAQ